MAVPNVSFIRYELSVLLPLYYLIRDCLSGEPTIKAAKTKYLPMPSVSGDTKEDAKRYESYLGRAVFYNVTRHTLGGLLGQVFMRDPVIKIGKDLEPVVNNATGTGVSLVQEAKRAVSYVLSYARAGVFVDFPNTGGELTQADINAGKGNPTINVASPFNIINWRVKPDGSLDKLSLIVMAESYQLFDDGFEIKNALQFRVMYLDAAGLYVQEIWREPNNPSIWDGRTMPKNKIFQRVDHETTMPTDAQGNRFTEIPFWFIGTENNDPNPDQPNMYDLSSINVAHYRNSADYEESCFVMGQPTVVMTGLTQEWVEKVLKGTVAFGARGGIPLPQGASAAILQAGENTMIKEAMETKERQMVALGAKLVEQKEVQRTAFETKVDTTASSSILASSTKNVSVAFENALKWATKFTGGNPDTIEFKLNTDFDIAAMTPEERNQAINEWQKGAITWTEMRTALRRGGSATEDDAKAKTEIAADTAAQLALDAQFNTPTGAAGE